MSTARAVAIWILAWPLQAQAMGGIPASPIPTRETTASPPRIPTDVLGVYTPILPRAPLEGSASPDGEAPVAPVGSEATSTARSPSAEDEALGDSGHRRPTRTTRPRRTEKAIELGAPGRRRSMPGRMLTAGRRQGGAEAGDGRLWPVLLLLLALVAGYLLVRRRARARDEPRA